MSDYSSYYSDSGSGAESESSSQPKKKPAPAPAAKAPPAKPPPPAPAPAATPAPAPAPPAPAKPAAKKGSDYGSDSEYYSSESDAPAPKPAPAKPAAPAPSSPKAALPPPPPVKPAPPPPKPEPTDSDYYYDEEESDYSEKPPKGKAPPKPAPAPKPAAKPSPPATPASPPPAQPSPAPAAPSPSPSPAAPPAAAPAPAAPAPAPTPAAAAPWTPEARGPSGPDAKKARSREKKWGDMLAKYDTFRKSKKATIDERVMKGIPDKHRGVGWLYLVHPDSAAFDAGGGKKKDSREKRFKKWAKKTQELSPAPAFVAGLFDASKAADLAQVVGALLVAEKTKIPYTPALGYVPSLLLSYLPPWKAFTAFLYLVTSGKHLTSNYFHEERVEKLAAVWDLVLQKRVPRVHGALLKLGVEHKRYLAGWLQTAFLAIEFPAELRLRVFDRFAKFGTRALFAFGATVALVAQEKIAAAADAEAAVAILNEPSGERGFQNVPDIIKKYNAFFLRKKEYSELVKKLGNNKKTLP